MTDNKPTCFGVTSTNKQCMRTKLQDNGYCFQHQSQALSAADNDGRVAFDMDMEPLLSLSSIDSDMPVEDDDRSAAAPSFIQMPSPILMEPVDLSDHEHNNGEELLSRDSPDHSNVGKLNDYTLLRQCKAIASSTGIQCRKLVSFADQLYCPAHGGTQKSPVQPQLPQCQGISTKTRRPCQRHVSIAGETHCFLHGGKSKKAAFGAIAATTTVAPTMALQTKTTTMIVPWPLLMTKCVDFVLKEHGEPPCHECHLDDAPCASLTVVLWIQHLAKLCTKHLTSQPTPAILRTWLADTSINHGKHDRFMLILTASRIFGPANMRWLLLQLDDDELTGEEAQP